MTKREHAAIDAVARQYRGTWEERDEPHSVCLVIAGERIYVDIRTLKRRGVGRRNSGKPRLRFDKAVNQLMRRLEATLTRIVPDGLTVLLTVTAPIHLGLKTAAALETKIQRLLGRGSRDSDVKATIHRNRVRIRLMGHNFEQAPKLIGFVHNPETDALLLLDMSRELGELLSGLASLPRRVRRQGDRWLVLLSSEGVACLEAYRYIYSRLRRSAGLKKVLLMFADGRAAELTG